MTSPGWALNTPVGAAVGFFSTLTVCGCSGWADAAMAASTDCGSARNWVRVATASSRVGTETPSIRTVTLVIGAPVAGDADDQALESEQIPHGLFDQALRRPQLGGGIVRGAAGHGRVDLVVGDHHAAVGGRDLQQPAADRRRWSGSGSARRARRGPARTRPTIAPARPTPTCDRRSPARRSPGHPPTRRRWPGWSNRQRAGRARSTQASVLTNRRAESTPATFRVREPPTCATATEDTFPQRRRSADATVTATREPATTKARGPPVRTSSLLRCSAAQ